MLEQRGAYRYGIGPSDTREEISAYADANGYPVHHCADAACHCGSGIFHLALDEVEGVAVRTCALCSATHVMADGADYLEGAELESCACPCGHEAFEVVLGVSLYDGSDDVRWIYLGCRCQACSLTAVYGDWKNEYEGYAQLLALA